MTKFKDVLNLYLGCEFEFDNRRWVFKEIHRHTIRLVRNDDKYGKFVDINPEQGKPILRRLEDATEEEQIFLCSLQMPPGWAGVKLLDQTADDWAMRIKMQTEGGDGSKSVYVSKRKFTPAVFRYLLSKNFDLFNLIDNGEAIDINKQG